MIKNYKIRLHVLSPIHIGMGDNYNPTQFVFDKDGIMWVFNTNDFLKSLSPEKSLELSKIAINSLNPVSVFRFFRDNFDKDKIKCRQIKASEDVHKRYEEILRLGVLEKNALNQFELKRNIFNPIKNVPYIPGSSIKGCLKTLWMSEVNRCSNQPITQNPEKAPKQDKIKELEKRLLNGSFSQDPFRFVKVSDFYPVENDDIFLSRIMYAVMFPRKVPNNVSQQRETDRSSLTVALEVIPAGNIFEGTISLDDQAGLPSNLKIKPISILGLQQKSKYYYFKHQKNIKDKKTEFVPSKMLETAGFTQKLGVNVTYATKIIDKFKTKDPSFPIRIGFHTGAEFMTIDGCRSIKITPPNVREKKYADKATTLWLASSKKKPESPKNLQEFGWVLLEFEEIK